MKSDAGTCPFCNQKAGILSRSHTECRWAFQAGWNEMVRLAGSAARSHEFNPNSLQVSLAEIARRSYGNGSTVARALEEGWRRAVRNAATDGSITHEEKFRLRGFGRTLWSGLFSGPWRKRPTVYRDFFTLQPDSKKSDGVEALVRLF